MTKDESAQLLGLASASIAGSFVANGTVLSLLYDAMKVEWNNGSPDPERMPSTYFTIVASPGARGRTVTLEVAGFSYPAGAGSIQLDVGGTQVSATSTEENLRATLTATLSADNDLTPVTVTLDLAKPEDGAAVGLNLDTIDIALSDC